MRMKKSRWRRVLLWSSIGLIILIISSLFVMNYAVDKVLRSMSGMDTIMEEIEVLDAKDSSAVTDEASPTPDATNTSSTSPTSTPTPTTNNEQDRQPDTSTQPSKPTPQSSTDMNYQAEISTDKASAIKDKATISEKAKVTTLLVSNLSTNDLKHLSELASGGLSVEEKKKARALILEKLSEEEYNQLIRIAQKYGLSKGKTYKEVIKE